MARAILFLFFTLGAYASDIENDLPNLPLINNQTGDEEFNPLPVLAFLEAGLVLCAVALPSLAVVFIDPSAAINELEAHNELSELKTLQSLYGNNRDITNYFIKCHLIPTGILAGYYTAKNFIPAIKELYKKRPKKFFKF